MCKDIKKYIRKSFLGIINKLQTYSIILMGDIYSEVNNNDIKDDYKEDWGDIINTHDLDKIDTDKNGSTNISISSVLDTKNSKFNDHVNIENIVAENCNYNDLSDIELLQRATIISKNIKYQFNKKSSDQTELISWLSMSVTLLNNILTILSNRLGLNPKLNQNGKQSDRIPHNTTLPADKVLSKINDTIKLQNNKHTASGIVRNSYKFCEYGYSCKYNYSFRDKCYSQHYVYDFVVQDIYYLLQYINHPIELDFGEIKTTINTIAYVINHMFDELTQLKGMDVANYDSYVNKKFMFFSKNKSKGQHNKRYKT